MNKIRLLTVFYHSSMCAVPGTQSELCSMLMLPAYFLGQSVINLPISAHADLQCRPVYGRCWLCSYSTCVICIKGVPIYWNSVCVSLYHNTILYTRHILIMYQCMIETPLPKCSASILCPNNREYETGSSSNEF